MKQLPAAFLQKMSDLLQNEYQDYLNTLNDRPRNGLRVNTGKISVDDFLKIAPFKLTPIPWSEDGFYYEDDQRPAKHPYYYAGLYYLQEPSAMLPAEALPISKGDIVLDACAAPGGKSSKLANKLHNTGLLLSNDISASRSQITLRTLESQGVMNGVVMAQDMTKLERFSNTFDKILVDAPCSGEGMFRKDPSLIDSWSKNGPEYYSAIQKQIIEKVLPMLKPGGMLVYSTCTFDPRENEEVIEYALDLDKDLETVPIQKYPGFHSGITDRTKDCIRLYPHCIEGEGHFVALLKKNGSAPDRRSSSTKLISDQEPFLKSLKLALDDFDVIRKDDRLLAMPHSDVDLKGLRILRSGLLVGTYKHDRFEPSQALALALNKERYDNVIDLPLSDERVLKYLKCETLDVRDYPNEGMVLVCVDGFPLGFGKVTNHSLKNRYPADRRYI